MAKKKHRKLFSIFATERNITLDCLLGVCDPICAYNCYPEHDYYAASPQLSPWSSPQPITSPSPSISAVYQPSENPSSSSSLDAITILTITGAVLAILLTGFFLVAKFVSDSVNRVNHNEIYQSERDYDDIEQEEFQDSEQVDHPIWLIRTTGLQQSIINSITIVNYKRGDGLIERTDCPVCLSEFEDEESLRLLPKCNHAFHISCIDTWLRSHTNCPLCRAGIAISAATPRCSGPVDPGGSGSRVEETGVGEDQDRGLGRENDDDSGTKERLSSSNTDPNSDVRIEVYGSVNEIHRDSEEIDGVGSETETKDQARAPNGGDSIDVLLHTISEAENIDFQGKTGENQSQDFTRQENRDNGDEPSCSIDYGEGGHKVKSQRSLDSIDSGESNGLTTEDSGSSQSDISSNTSKTIGSSSVSYFKTNKSSIFPL